MTSDPQDRPNRHHWPPILYGAVVVAGWLIQRHLSPPPVLPPPTSLLIGAPLALAGAGFGMAGLWHFYRVGTSFDPTAPATVLAKHGVYRYTRNPMYLGAVLLFAGAGLALPAASLVWLAIPLAYGLWKLAIEPEETYLTRRFGRDYLEYKNTVRRWI